MQMFKEAIDCPTNMAAVHFTTMPCEPNTAGRHEESHLFLRNNILYAKFGPPGPGGYFLVKDYW